MNNVPVFNCLVFNLLMLLFLIQFLYLPSIQSPVYGAFVLPLIPIHYRKPR